MIDPEEGKSLTISTEALKAVLLAIIGIFKETETESPERLDAHDFTSLI